MELFNQLFYEPGISPLSCLIRLGLACLLGGVVGFERGLHNQAMGIRTHILICLSACLVMATGIFMSFGTATDPTRIAAQVVSGIGFLGAGTIMHWGLDIKGLTTAASIWATAAVGLACGAGLYLPAVLVTLLILVSLRFLAPVSHRMTNRETQALVLTHGLALHTRIGDINRILAEHGLSAGPPAVEYARASGQSSLSFHVKMPVDLDIGALIDHLSQLEGVEKASLELLK